MWFLLGKLALGLKLFSKKLLLYIFLEINFVLVGQLGIIFKLLRLALDKLLMEIALWLGKLVSGIEELGTRFGLQLQGKLWLS